MGGVWGGIGRAMQDGWGMGRDGQDDAGWVVNRQSNTVGEHCSNGSRGDHHSSWTKRDTDMSDGVPTIMNPLGRGEASPCHRPARLAFVMGSSRRIQQGREGSTVWDPATYACASNQAITRNSKHGKVGVLPKQSHQETHVHINAHVHLHMFP